MDKIIIKVIRDDRSKGNWIKKQTDKWERKIRVVTETAG